MQRFPPQMMHNNQNNAQQHQLAMQAQMSMQVQAQQQQQQMILQQQMQQQHQMLQKMMSEQYTQNAQNDTSTPVQLQGSPPASNQLLHQFQNMQNAGYNAQLQQVISHNPLLSNPLIISNRERLLTQMRNEQEAETIRRAQESVNDKKISSTDLMRIITLRPVELPKKGENQDEQSRTRNRDVHIQYDFVNSSWDVEGEKYKQNRTNQPYKIIINREENREDPKRLLEKERIWQSTKDDAHRPNFRDLIVHTVTDADKDGVVEEHDRENTMRKDLDDENRVIYSEQNRTKHKKQFEYKHIYRYRIRIDSKNHIELKDDRVEYYEDQQRKLEVDRAQSDALLSMMQENDMIDREMLDAGLQKPDEEVVDDEVDALMTRLGLAPRKSKKDRHGSKTADMRNEPTEASKIAQKPPATATSSRFVSSSRSPEVIRDEPKTSSSMNQENDDIEVISFSSRRSKTSSRG